MSPRQVQAAGAITRLFVERLKEQHMAITSFEGTILELGLCDETGSLPTHPPSHEI